MKSTGVMALLVAGLAAYTFYEFKNSDDSVSSGRAEKRVFFLLRDNLEEIDIHAKAGDTVLKKQGDKWQMTKPVEDLAEASAVESFVYSLLIQKGKEFRAESGKPVWADFGLEPAGGSITIRGKGKVESLEISSKNAFDGSYYIRVKDQLWLGDRALAQLLDRAPSEFRSRKVYRGPEEINSVEVKLDFEGIKQSFKLQRDSAKSVWSLDPKPDFAVDSTKVAEWVQKWTALNGTDFVTEIPAAKPSMEVRMGGEVISVVADSANAYLTVEKRNAIYRVSAPALNPLRVPPIYFRDGKTPFKFNLELVRQIEIHSGSVNTLIEKKDSNWAIQHPVAGMELDQEKLLELVRSVQNLDAAEFVDGPAKGLPASPQLSFKSADGKVLLSLAWGAPYKPKYGFNQGLTLALARVSGVKEAVGLPKDKLDRLVDSAIIKKKAESK